MRDTFVRTLVQLAKEDKRIEQMTMREIVDSFKKHWRFAITQEVYYRVYALIEQWVLPVDFYLVIIFYMHYFLR